SAAEERDGPSFSFERRPALVTHPAPGMTKARPSRGRKGHSCHLRRSFRLNRFTRRDLLGRCCSSAARITCASRQLLRRGCSGLSFAGGGWARSFGDRLSSATSSWTSVRPPPH